MSKALYLYMIIWALSYVHDNELITTIFSGDVMLFLLFTGFLLMTKSEMPLERHLRMILMVCGGTLVRFPYLCKTNGGLTLW